MINNNIGNGIVTPRLVYSKKRRDGLKNIIKVARKELLKKYGTLDHSHGVCAGSRFDNDENIIARLESTNQDEIKSAGWMQSVRCALINAMMTDYFYRYEKEY